MKKVLPYILALIMLAGAVGHIFYPEFYEAMIPVFFPLSATNILAAIVEGATGIILLIPRYRRTGGLVFASLMFVFLPIHIWDLFKDEPAVGSHAAATIRLIIQFLLIYLGWRTWKPSKRSV